MRRSDLEHVLRAASAITNEREFGPTTAILPAGWEARLVAVTNANTNGAVGQCLELHDLLAAKYVAARDKDRRFCRDAVRRGLADEATLLERVAVLPVDDDRRRLIVAEVVHDLSAARNQQ